MTISTPEASPTYQVPEQYATYFADELVSALPGTFDYAHAWRSVMLATIFTAAEQGDSDAVTLNAYYRTELEQAAQRKGCPVPTVARMALDTKGWRRQHRRLMADLQVPKEIPLADTSPVGLLGMLAMHTAEYRSLTIR